MVPLAATATVLKIALQPNEYSPPLTDNVVPTPMPAMTIAFDTCRLASAASERGANKVASSTPNPSVADPPVQFEVNYFNDEERAGPFAVGIDFEQGTPAQVRLRGGRHMPVFFYWLRNRFFPNLEEPKWEPTWSDTVPTDKLGGGN